MTCGAEKLQNITQESQRQPVPMPSIFSIALVHKPNSTKKTKSSDHIQTATMSMYNLLQKGTENSSVAEIESKALNHEVQSRPEADNYLNSSVSRSECKTELCDDDEPQLMTWILKLNATQMNLNIL